MARGAGADRRGVHWVSSCASVGVLLSRWGLCWLSPRPCGGGAGRGAGWAALVTDPEGTLRVRRGGWVVVKRGASWSCKELRTHWVLGAGAGAQGAAGRREARAPGSAAPAWGSACGAHVWILRGAPRGAPGRAPSQPQVHGAGAGWAPGRPAPSAGLAQAAHGPVAVPRRERCRDSRKACAEDGPGRTSLAGLCEGSAASGASGMVHDATGAE